MPLRIAALQHPGHPGDVEQNLRVVADAARRAAADGAGLLVTPEMFVTGYNIGADVARLAVRDLERELAGIAVETAVAIAAGLPVPTTDGVANTVLLLAADGTRLTRYDKTHLFAELDRELFTPGARLPEIVELDGVRIALLICYDVEFPEMTRAAALAGAELVLVPTAQMQPFEYIAEHLPRVRAWENQVYVGYVNRVGREGDLSYVGRSSIVGPDGVPLATAGPDETTLLVADVDPAVVRAAQRANPYLADLRRDLYPTASTADQEHA